MNRKKGNPKMSAITSLRVKILELRNQLQNLQKVDIQFSPARSRKNPGHQNQTIKLATPKSNHRQTNPESPIKIYTKSKSKSKDHFRTQHSRIKLQNPTSTSKERGCIKNKTLQLNLKGLSKQQPEIPNIRYQTMFFPRSLSRSTSRSRSFSNQSLSRASTKKFIKFQQEELQTPRFQRQQSIKTYALQPTNPILNPPQQKFPSRRMFTEKNYSPSNMYLNHSGSNTNTFCSQNLQVLLSNKNRQNKKNISQMLAEYLPHTTQSRQSRGKTQQKRHFTRHLNETAGDLIYLC